MTTDGGARDAEGAHQPPLTEAEPGASTGASDEETSSAHRVDMDQIHAKVKLSFEKVPAIGTGWRWYDVPYRFLMWMLTSWRRRLLPWRLRYRLINGINFLIAFEHYERLKVMPRDDPIENLIVPLDETLTQGGVWVVEFFPPSYYSQLLKALNANGWDEQNRLLDLYGTNAERVTRARHGRGFGWSRLGMVASPDSPHLPFGAKREVLPDEFDLVELTAVQLGRSITAVVGFVGLSEHGRGALDAVWKAPHEPSFEWRGLQRPNVEGRYFAAIRTTQRERQRLHDLARTWLAERCSGYFADTAAGQPVVDFNLFARFDPSIARCSRELDAPLSALGMEGDHLYNYASPQLPGALFVQGEALSHGGETLRNCWGVVGAYEAVDRLNDRVGYGEKPHSVSTLGKMADDAIRNFLLYVGVEQYTDQLRETYSNARDTARKKHGEFKPRQLEQLKRELLTTSLDLPVVARDTALLWGPRGRMQNGIEITAVAKAQCPSSPGRLRLHRTPWDGAYGRFREAHRGGRRLPGCALYDVGPWRECSHRSPCPAHISRIFHVPPRVHRCPAYRSRRFRRAAIGRLALGVLMQYPERGWARGPAKSGVHRSDLAFWGA